MSYYNIIYRTCWEEDCYCRGQWIRVGNSHHTIVSFTVPAGKKIAIVGGSRSG